MNAWQQSILQVVIDEGRMSVVDLAKTTGVSKVIARQDLNLLGKQSYSRCTHGYTVPLDSGNAETRMMTHFTIKRELASRTTALVSAGEAVLIENSSSDALLARTLAGCGDITIVTISSYIVHLPKETLGEVILLDGTYQKHNESMVGPLTRQFIQQVRFNKAFIGVDGWQAETGFTSRDVVRADAVNAALEKHCEATTLSDSSELSAVHPYPLGPTRHFSHVIIDNRLPATCRNQLLHSSLTVDIVPYI